MKQLVTTYTFDASLQTVDAASFTAIEQILLITNVVDNVIIYNFADATKGGTLASTTLTLVFDTTTMSDTDELQIWIDDLAQGAKETGGNLAAAATSLGILDNIVAGSEAQVDVVTSALPTGASTAANQTTANGLLTTIDADTSALAGTVSGTELQVDVLTLPAVTGTVTANAGTNLNTSALSLEATQADVRTALQIIDDWDESDRAKVNPIAGQAGVAGGSGAVSALTQRVVPANAFGKTIKRAVVSLSASGNIVAAAGASKAIRVFAFAAQSRNDSMTLQVTSGSGGSAISLRWAFNTREGVSQTVTPLAWLMITADNTALYATITGTGTIDIEVSYWDDDAA